MITVDYSFVAFRHCIAGLKAEPTELPGALGADIAPGQEKVSVLVDDLTAADALWDVGRDAVDATSGSGHNTIDIPPTGML
ncbi:hypothetical protein [Glycomyces tenuis]|uniref:hypothetical protein n=1 Tax=Glycomyces tenuis TaxID=58116 RepID=UPI00047EEAFC|nr:hypothetical protein [Glycomyces tenuis]